LAPLVLLEEASLADQGHLDFRDLQAILDHKDSKVREALQVCQVSRDLQVLLVHQENGEKRATGGQKELALKDLWGHEDYQDHLDQMELDFLEEKEKEGRLEDQVSLVFVGLQVHKALQDSANFVIMQPPTTCRP
jgi:hypothetical protein